MLYLFWMTRPVNALIAMVSVWIGGWIAGAVLKGPWLWLEGLAMGLLAALGNLHNDWVDREVDRINRPERPLPSGKISPQALGWTIGILLACVLALGVYLGVPHLLFFVSVAGLLYFYNKVFKGLPLFGNFAVALLCASALMLPTIEPRLWGEDSQPWVLVPLAFFSLLFTSIRELIKDIEDVPGDRAAGLTTFPVLLGVAPRRSLVQWCLVASVFSPGIPVALGIFPKVFLLASVALVIPPILMALFFVHSSHENWRKAQKMLKLAMVGGLFATAITWKGLQFI
ncbi:MAG TPA: geranylgeranylglycerol-phosphate geranylgeranyltransferase [Fibrobacteraceae bacterium]|nr:geranylgeranylglycerol-phosphate geranylgeranyltransferase [Fibrobacteraceae bacterium]